MYGPQRSRPRNRALFGFLLASLVLLVASIAGIGGLSLVRDGIQTLTSPIIAAGLRPLEPVRDGMQRITRLWSLDSELERLRAENQQLKGWKWRAEQLQKQVDELTALTHLVRNQDLGYVTGEVLSAPLGPFRRHAVIKTGAKANVRTGDPVVNGDGLVGIVYKVGPMTTRVQLLNDPDSAIPVLIGDANIPGRMVGRRHARPALTDVEARSVVVPGDIVSTSGARGSIPKGLKVGVIVTTGDVLEVEPYASLAGIQYVSVLLRQTPAKTAERRTKLIRK